MGCRSAAPKRHSTRPRRLPPNGAGALVIPAGGAGQTTAAVDADGEVAGSADETCESAPLSDLTAQLPLLGLDLACSSSLAVIEGGNPGAVSTARVGTLTVASTNDLLGGTPLEGVVGQIQEGLAPILGMLPAEIPVDVDGLVAELTEAIEDGGNLLTIEIGPTASAVDTTPEAVSAAAGAEGATIKVLERNLLDLEPVLTINIGEAAATASVNRTDGTTAATFDPSLVRIAIASDIALLLGIPDDQRVITVPIGQTIDIPLPAPLTSRIVAANGATAEEAGSATASASAVRLDLFMRPTGRRHRARPGRRPGHCRRRGRAAATAAPSPAGASGHRPADASPHGRRAGPAAGGHCPGRVGLDCDGVGPQVNRCLVANLA
ncbi:hypothetical protein BH24ACT3_BH24ACT3_11580 [soil metagenome]